MGQKPDKIKYAKPLSKLKPGAGETPIYRHHKYMKQLICRPGKNINTL